MENMNIPQLTSASTLVTIASVTSFDVAGKLSFIRPYVATTVCEAGYRLAVIRWRVLEKDKATVSKPAQMAMIPQIKLPEEYTLIPEKAQKVLLGLFEDTQDDIIRARIEAKISNVSWDDISLDAVLESLTAIRVSQRLTKEQIDAWFKVAMLAACTTRATDLVTQAGKQGDATEVAKYVAGVTNKYCDLATKLAAPVPNIGQNEATALEAMLKGANLADDMARVLLSKLDAILRPKILGNNEYL